MSMRTLETAVLAEARRLGRIVHLNSPSPTLPADLAPQHRFQLLAGWGNRDDGAGIAVEVKPPRRQPRGEVGFADPVTARHEDAVRRFKDRTRDFRLAVRRSGVEDVDREIDRIGIHGTVRRAVQFGQFALPVREPALRQVAETAPVHGRTSMFGILGGFGGGR